MNKRYRFGPFLLDAGDQVLLREGEALAVPPKVFEVLRYFVEHPGRLISREDLLTGVWHGVYVADQALTQMLRKVRVVLGDEVGEVRYLQTVYGRGYRFVAAVVVEGGDAAPPACPAPPRPPDRHHGHQGELARLTELHGEGARLIFLVGAPGVGKSRLAAEFAAALVEGGGSRGVAWVDLGRAVGEDALLAALRVGLGGAVEAQLALSAAPSVVILDQTDRVVEPLAGRIGGWMQASPGTCFLATGREALRVSGESVCPVRPLLVPDPSAPLSELLASPAVALFQDRARAVLPEYTVTEADAHSVAALVAALDGLPLAIELAAARVRSLPPKALLDRLEHRFDLLESPHRDLPERHRSLRAAIDESWMALPAWGQSALAALASLEGAWTLERGEATLGPSPRGVPPACAIIDALFGRSLLRAIPGPEGIQYRLLESVRAYARLSVLD